MSATASDLVLVTLLCEAVVLALALIAILLHIAWRSFEDPRRAARVAGAQQALTQVLGARDDAADDPLPALRRLRRGERLEVFAGYAAVAGGSGRAALASLAGRTGIAAEAAAQARSRRWTARLSGARALTAAGVGEDVMPPLLDDPHPAVRAQAAEWAGTQGGDDAIARLIAHLGDPAAATRFAAQDAVIRLGPRAGPVVARELEAAQEGQLAVSLLEVAAAVGDLTACRAAERFLHARDPRARELACRAVARLGDPAAVSALEDALADADEGVRAAAASALGSSGNWPSAPKLRRALRDPAWEVRRSAALALRGFGATGEVLLRQALTDEDRFARDMARRVLELESEA